MVVLESTDGFTGSTVDMRQTVQAHRGEDATERGQPDSADPFRLYVQFSWFEKPLTE